MPLIKIGTRGSRLALVQANIIADAVKNICPDFEIEIVVIKTQGDKILDKPLSEIGDKGLFVSEIETALQNKEIDIAVHSAKDLPVTLGKGLKILCTPKRADARDVLIQRKNNVTECGLKHLPNNPVIGTGSPRRELYMKRLCPSAQFKLIRGNVDTRLKKLAQGDYDAIILAKAGLDRLGLTESQSDKFHFTPYETKDFLPAACQGIIAVETRDDYEFNEKITLINHNETFFRYKLERDVLNRLQTDCSEPCAAFCEYINDKDIELTVMYGGKEASVIGTSDEVIESVRTLADKVKGHG